jgi:hypothetical protein
VLVVVAAVSLPHPEVRLPQVSMEQSAARCSFKQQATQLPYVIAGGDVVHAKNLLQDIEIKQQYSTVQ